MGVNANTNGGRSRNLTLNMHVGPYHWPQSGKISRHEHLSLFFWICNLVTPDAYTHTFHSICNPLNVTHLLSKIM